MKIHFYLLSFFKLFLLGLGVGLSATPPLHLSTRTVQVVWVGKREFYLGHDFCWGSFVAIATVVVGGGVTATNGGGIPLGGCLCCWCC